MPEYYVIFKPYGMLSQFSKDGDKATLADLGSFSQDVYPVGRLDSDSEGLLILSNDRRLNNELLNPVHGHKRTYLAQVEGIAEEDKLEELRRGVEISVNGKKHGTKPAVVAILKNEPILPERVPPIRFRKNVPTSWLQLEISEGKNRQVRKMTAAVGLPTLRLVRSKIVSLNIEGMAVGEVKRLDAEALGEALNLPYLKKRNKLL